MSDFLANLVARSRGTLPVIRPQVPSLYEPYRPASTPTGIAPEAIPAAKDIPPEESRFDSKTETADTSSPTHTSPAHPPATAPLQVKTAKRLIDTPLAEQWNRVRPVSFEAPSPSQSEVEGPAPTEVSSGVASPVPEAISRPNFPLLHHQASGSAAEPRTVLSKLIPPVKMGQAVDEEPHRRHEGADADFVNAGGSGHGLELNESQAATSVRQRRSADVGPEEIDLPNASTLAAPRSFTSTNRTPLLRRADAVSAVPPARQSTGAEPPIRVTIGRIDVRAVFPEPAPRQVQAARPKTTLSLDDYLKQRNRGQR